MRITQNSMTRNYLNNLNASLFQKSQSESRLTTGRRYTRISESVSSGTRALTIRTELYKNEQIQKNVGAAYESLSVAEGALMNIKDALSTVAEKTLKAVNGTNDSEIQHEIFADTFSKIKGQVIQFANSKYQDTYCFGCTNNKSEPFTVADDGSVQFNGVNVKDIKKIDDIYESVDGTAVPFSKDIYIDIGAGMSVKNGEIDPRTAFKVSVSGLEAIGYGTSQIEYTGINGDQHTIEVSNNLCEIVDEISAAITDGDMDRAMALNDHMNDKLDDLILVISDIGVRTSYLENNADKLVDDEYVLTEIQSNLEKIKDTDELVNYKSLEYSWLLTLQYGGKMLPQSLMDYVS